MLRSIIVTTLNYMLLAIRCDDSRIPCWMLHRQVLFAALSDRIQMLANGL